MNRMHRLMIPVLLLSALPSLGACSRTVTDDPGNTQALESSKIEATMKQTMREVRQQINEGNIKLSSDDKTLPRAEITPEGDLLIGGDKVTIDARQRRLLLQHREHIVQVASAGAEIGIQGAELATRAMGEAFKSVFSGDTEGVEQRVQAEAAKLEDQAALLCDRMPALLQSQQALADAVPEFRPYATMDESDLDCRDESRAAGEADPRVQ